MRRTRAPVKRRTFARWRTWCAGKPLVSSRHPLVFFGWFPRRVLFGQIFTQAIEAGFPLTAPASEPALDPLEDGRFELACAYPTLFARADQAARLEHLQVLDHSGQSHRERLRELAHRGRAAAQAVHHTPAHGVGERVKYAVERRSLRLRAHDSLGKMAQNGSASRSTRANDGRSRKRFRYATARGKPSPIGCTTLA